MPKSENYVRLFSAHHQKQTLFALLIDPDKERWNSESVDHFQFADLLLIGSSLLNDSNTDSCIRLIKRRVNLPILLFPGHSVQLSDQADGILFLSLVSGCNPEYLIGQQVVAAPWLKRSGLEVLPTGYLLIDGGRPSSVAYISQTQPIPRDKPGLAVATAQAAELLGMRLLYLEAGSGAQYPVPPGLIEAIRQEVDLPLIVGGGLREPAQVRAAARAGASLLVVGTAAERDPGRMAELAAAARC